MTSNIRELLTQFDDISILASDSCPKNFNKHGWRVSVYFYGKVASKSVVLTQRQARPTEDNRQHNALL